MQRMMLIGPSQCGKTSLTQCLRGENIHYQKTQAIVWSPTTIDTPGRIPRKPQPLQCTVGQCLRSGHYRAGA
ncbi:EutP/PduV family microcompartment system protein [Escherichia coli]|nr:EutP/PduV family microcompartment system protein [Escherichia coli]